jgi:hypothetical protein
MTTLPYVPTPRKPGKGGRLHSLEVSDFPAPEDVPSALPNNGLGRFFLAKKDKYSIVCKLIYGNN